MWACVLIAVFIGGVTSGRSGNPVVSPSVFADMDGNSQSPAGAVQADFRFSTRLLLSTSVPESHRLIIRFRVATRRQRIKSTPSLGSVTFRLSTTTANSLTSNFRKQSGR